MTEMTKASAVAFMEAKKFLSFDEERKKNKQLWKNVFIF